MQCNIMWIALDMCKVSLSENKQADWGHHLENTKESTKPRQVKVEQVPQEQESRTLKSKKTFAARGNSQQRLEVNLHVDGEGVVGEEVLLEVEANGDRSAVNPLSVHHSHCALSISFRAKPSHKVYAYSKF